MVVSLTNVPTFYLQIATKRAPTSGLEPLSCSLRVISQALQGCAGGCKTLILRRVYLLRVAECCTVLRSRWCQSGVNSGVAYRPSQSLILRVLENGRRYSASRLVKGRCIGMSTIVRLFASAVLAMLVEKGGVRACHCP